MKYLLIALLLTGCSSYPVKRVAITHDYIFYNAIKMCKPHGGLHYVVVDETIFAKSSERDGHSDDYPCQEKHYFRCQDQTLLIFNSGVEYCFISENQLQETLPLPLVKEPRERSSIDRL